MITINANGIVYSCTKAVKGPDFIQLYDEENNLIISFSGISNFVNYTIEGGTWSMPDPTESDRMEAQMLYTALMTDTLLEV